MVQWRILLQVGHNAAHLASAEMDVMPPCTLVLASHYHWLEELWVDLRRPRVGNNHPQCAVAAPDDEVAAGALAACCHPQRDQVLARTLVLEDVAFQTDLHQR
jgi:hypothetical protein